MPMSLTEYKQWYFDTYGKYPGEKCIETYKQMYPKEEVATEIPEDFWRDPDPKLPKIVMEVKYG